MISPRAKKGEWKCVKCKQTQPKEHFRLWMTAKSTNKAKNCKCNVCWSGELLEQRQLSIANMKHVQLARTDAKRRR